MGTKNLPQLFFDVLFFFFGQIVLDFLDEFADVSDGSLKIILFFQVHDGLIPTSLGLVLAFHDFKPTLTRVKVRPVSLVNFLKALRYIFTSLNGAKYPAQEHPVFITLNHNTLNLLATKI